MKKSSLKETVAETKNRFLSKVRKDGRFQKKLRSRCWKWTGWKLVFGYGMFKYKGKDIGAHVASYILFVGPVPSGKMITHACHNPECSNWKHLVPDTQRANIRQTVARGTHFNASKSFCRKGHPFDAVNTYWSRWNRRRLCRICLKLHQHNGYMKRKYGIPPVPGK